MTIKELIQELQKYPEDTKIYLRDDWDYCSDSEINNIAPEYARDETKKLLYIWVN